MSENCIETPELRRDVEAHLPKVAHNDVLSADASNGVVHALSNDMAAPAAVLGDEVFERVAVTVADMDVRDAPALPENLNLRHFARARIERVMLDVVNVAICPFPQRSLSELIIVMRWAVVSTPHADDTALA